MRYSSSVKSPYALARSPRVAVVLLALGIASSILATFVHSPLFLIPVALFAVSLGACAVGRMADRIRGGARHRFGPDLIHLGLLALVCGGFISTLGRQEKTYMMATGDEAQISPSRTLRLLSLSVQRYPDGSPRDWVSTVAVTRSGSSEIPAFPIRVNAPLRLRGLNVYQASWATQGILDLTDASGARLGATTGQGFEHDGFLWYFAGVEPAVQGLSAVFEQWKGREKVGIRRVQASGTIGPFTVVRVTAREVTGLKAVRDPGFPVVIAALVVFGAGLALTFIQGWRDSRQ